MPLTTIRQPACPSAGAHLPIPPSLLACKVGEYFGYVKNQLYAPLFPAHAALRAEGKGKGDKAGAGKSATAGVSPGVTAVAAIVA